MTSWSAEMGKAAVRLVPSSECARDVVGHTNQDSAQPLVNNVRNVDDETICRAADTQTHLVEESLEDEEENLSTQSVL